MFQLDIEDSFSAAHSLIIGGEREPVHGHDWKVFVTVQGEELDGDGLLCDFHHLESLLAEIIAPFRTADLNACHEFTRVNPSAENVACHIAERMRGGLPSAVSLTRVSVTEAPGCTATWLPGRAGTS